MLFAYRARDRAVAHIDLEGVLAEVVAVVGEPRTTDDGTAPSKDLVDDRRVDVTAIDVQRTNRQTLSFDVRDQAGCGVLFGPIGR